MATTVTLTWTTKPFTPTATDLSQYGAQLEKPDGTVVAPMVGVPFGTLTTSFPAPAPGPYVARVVLANADFSHQEDAATAAFAIPAAALDGPDVVTVAVS